MRIRDRAIRRAGELLKQIEPGRGANQNIGGGASPKVPTRKDAAREAGMSSDQAKQAIRVANVPADEFERQAKGKARHREAAGSRGAVKEPRGSAGDQAVRQPAGEDRSEEHHVECCHLTNSCHLHWLGCPDIQRAPLPDLAHYVVQCLPCVVRHVADGVSFGLAVDGEACHPYAMDEAPNVFEALFYAEKSVGFGAHAILPSWPNTPSRSIRRPE